jgi:DNA-binding transcriptional LysR family regulator
MGSSLPAVVRALAGYEESLGVRLFHRTTRRIALTEEGRAHLDHCRQVLTAVAEGEASLRQDLAEPSGLLTITAPVMFGQLHVAPLVTRFLQRHPLVRCRVLLLDREVNLLEEGIDVGVRIGPLEDSSLIARPLGHIRRVVVASPAFLAQHGMPSHPRDLQAAPCVCSLDGPTSWGPFRDQGKPLRVPVRGRLAFNHNAPAIDACMAGMGFGQFLSYQVAQHVQSKALTIVLSEFEDAPRPLQLVYPHARLLPARTRVFVEWIVQELRGFDTTSTSP